MFLSLFLLHYDCPFDVQVILFFQDVIEGRISAPINPDFLEFVSEMVFNWLLLEGLSLDNHIVFPFKNKAV